MENDKYYIGQVFRGEYPADVSVWCLNNHAFIDKISNKVYKIKSIFDKTKEEKMKAVRETRNAFLKRFVDQKQLLLVWESLSESEKEDIKNYRQYLLDYTKKENWYEKDPLTFDEWKTQKK